MPVKYFGEPATGFGVSVNGQPIGNISKEGLCIDPVVLMNRVNPSADDLRDIASKIDEVVGRK